MPPGLAFNDLLNRCFVHPGLPGQRCVTGATSGVEGADVDDVLFGQDCRGAALPLHGATTTLVLVPDASVVVDLLRALRCPELVAATEATAEAADSISVGVPFKASNAGFTPALWTIH